MDKEDDLWDQIYELHNDYLFSVFDDMPSNKLLQMRKTLEGLAADYLSIVPQQRRFDSAATWDIISNSAKWKPDFSFVKAAQAFRAIEQYAANLIKPCYFSPDHRIRVLKQKRLWSIHLNSSFYKHSIETALFGAGKMFMDMGYSPSPGQAQVLSLRMGEHPDNINMVTRVARDCLLAYVECHLLGEIHNKVSAQFPISIREVIDFRQDHTGSIDVCIRKLINLKQGEKEKLQGLCDRKEVGNFLRCFIQQKESELQCPVCFEVAGVPIFRCSKEHLICSSCRFKVSKCPECRVEYRGPPERYRLAERSVEEIQSLRKQLAGMK